MAQKRDHHFEKPPRELSSRTFGFGVFASRSRVRSCSDLRALGSDSCMPCSAEESGDL